jgi:hypothetical protein
MPLLRPDKFSRIQAKSRKKRGFADAIFQDYQKWKPLLFRAMQEKRLSVFGKPWILA